MAFFHFVNCLAVTCAPYLILYRFSGLSDLSWTKLLKPAIAYAATQLLKMLLLATVFPVSAVESERDDLVRETLKCTVDVLDLLGIHVLFTKFPSRSETGSVKVLSTVVGWGVLEVVATRVVPLWVSARGVEFSWRSLQAGLECNIQLLYLTTTVTLLWLWNRTDLNKPLLPLVASLLLSLSYSPLLFYLFSTYLTSGMWYLLLVKLTVGLATGSVALMMFGAMTQQQRHGKTD